MNISKEVNDKILTGNDVTEEYLDKYNKILKWNNVCKCVQLSESFIEKHKDKVHIVRQHFNDFVKYKI
jgi:hypothetical protein